MKKENLNSVIGLLIHQNLYVLNKGEIESPDFVVGGTDLLKKEIIKLCHFYSVNNTSVLLGFRKWQKENWKDIYLMSNDLMIKMYLDSL